MASGAKIQNFTWADMERLTFLFNEVNGISDTEKAYSVEFMRQFLSQPPYDPEHHCFLAELDGLAVGFALVDPEPPINRAVAGGGVLEPFRSRGIGRLLLRHAIDHTRSLKASVLHIEVSKKNAPARHLLESEGFGVVKGYWQMRWTGETIPEIALPNGFSFRSFRLGQDEEALTELQNTAFNDNWGFCPNTVEQISARVRLDRGKPEGIIFAVDGDRPAAYNWTMVSANQQKASGLISMTGVHPDYRSKGLGQSIVTAGMHYLKSQGVDGIELEVDAENIPARKLYLKLGFRKINETVWYEKGIMDSEAASGTACPVGQHHAA